MAIRKKAKLKGKSLASRLTGISCPIAGVSWTPPPDERESARKLITFLEDRRALFLPYDMEVGRYVVDSVLDIRKRLTAELEAISKSTTLGESLVAMRAACRKFLDETQQSSSQRYRVEPHLIECLSELRTMFGLHLARIACAYDLDIEEELTSILPAEPEREAVPQRHVQPTQTRKRRKSPS